MPKIQNPNILNLSPVKVTIPGNVIVNKFNQYGCWSFLKACFVQTNLTNVK
jgi:hypothetical protein